MVHGPSILESWRHASVLVLLLAASQRRGPGWCAGTVGCGEDEKPPMTKDNGRGRRTMGEANGLAGRRESRRRQPPASGMIWQGGRPARPGPRLRAGPPVHVVEGPAWHTKARSAGTAQRFYFIIYYRFCRCIHNSYESKLIIKLSV